MERQNPGMVRFMDRLDERMEVLDKRIQDKAVKAGEDYLSFFESHAEEAYKEYYLYKCFRDLKKKARESGSPEKVLEYLRKRQNVCLDTLLRQDIAARSTSPMRTWHTRCGSNASSCSWRITGISSGCLPTRYGSRRRCGMPGHSGKRKPEGAKTIGSFRSRVTTGIMKIKSSHG